MQKHIIDECSLSHTSVVDWSNFCREVCDEWLRQNPMEIGGVDNNGQPLVVEIDESKFFHRKYHRGLWRPGHWVFGGVERDSGKCFLVEVPDRTEQTLSEMIQRWILPRTHIISDGWASYANITNLGAMYIHPRSYCAWGPLCRSK
uniref:ISXO2-like transposase domain-containing protein n=1 Tax=Octopus bimaculoides TaxID=37653 RepID=A0A0L8GEG9_OCTBM